MSNIKICDAIMGSGKTASAINYMNGHPEKKFIYVTPYLDEANRIKESCPGLRFKEPRNDLPDYGFRKYVHTLELVRAGENITSTHSMFLRYEPELLDLIKEKGYTLIIDEAVDILQQAKIKRSDLNLLTTAGMIQCDSGKHALVTDKINGVPYDGAFNEIISLARGNRLVNMSPTKAKPYYYWILSQEIFDAFDEVIIMTYLFEAQMMKYYFDITKTPFEYIGISLDEKGYHFSPTRDYIPAYTQNLSQMIHIFENQKLNAIGDNEHALSSSWFDRHANGSEEMERLRKNIYNFFKAYNPDKISKHRLWSTFKKGVGSLRGKGFYRSMLVFNTKATNKYRDRDVLAYALNVFMPTIEKTYLIQNGVDVLEDRYALSVMVQWIWRSAIRDGNEIWIYVPSSRMRGLLKDWIDEVENEYAEYLEKRMEKDSNGKEEGAA